MGPFLFNDILARTPIFATFDTVSKMNRQLCNVGNILEGN